MCQFLWCGPCAVLFLPLKFEWFYSGCVYVYDWNESEIFIMSVMFEYSTYKLCLLKFLKNDFKVLKYV